TEHGQEQPRYVLIKAEAEVILNTFHSSEDISLCGFLALKPYVKFECCSLFWYCTTFSHSSSHIMWW
ncbi:hypothetical protein LSH36_304g03012, partial [Paralvinella palmiformis]